MLTLAFITGINKTGRRSSPLTCLVLIIGCFFEEDILLLVLTFISSRGRLKNLIIARMETVIGDLNGFIIRILT